MSLSPKLEVLLAIVAYSFCSGTLVLVNKLILHNLPYPSLVISVQLLFALAFINAAKFLKVLEVDPIKWKFVLPYLGYTIGFSLGIYCNMKSLSISNVETVIVFRATAPIVVAFLDAIFLGREYPSLRSWSALSLIVLGALGYASTDEKFQSQGLSAYTWPIAYLFIISFEMVFGKHILKSVDLKTLSGPVLYANLLGFPPMLMFAAMGNEYSSLREDISAEDDWITPGSAALLLLGCVVGTGIGYSGWWCRDKVSATSFTLIGVINKCLTVLLNLLVWDQHANPQGIACLFLCLVGGSLYKQAPLRKGYVKPATSESEMVDTNDSTEMSGTESNVDEEESRHLLDSQSKNSTAQKRGH